MSRFQMPDAVTEYAEDIAWHAMGFAQVVLDTVIVATLALAVYATGIGHDEARQANSGAVFHEAHISCAASNGVLTGADRTCITASVLQSLES